MKDKYKELSDCLSEIIDQVTEFDNTFNDYIKPLIRANLVKMCKLGSIIGDRISDDVNKLNDDIDIFLNLNEKNEAFKSLINDAINLKNDLWEL